MSFGELWQTLQRKLKPGDAVANWTAQKGYLGDSFTVLTVADNHVAVESPGAQNTQRIPRRDFEAVYVLWQGYQDGKVPRYALRDLTRFSKYIISIVHCLEERNQ